VGSASIALCDAGFYMEVCVMDKKVAMADLKQSFNGALLQQVQTAHQLVRQREELLLEADRDWQAKSADYAEKQVHVQVLIDQLAYLVPEVQRLRNVAGRAQSSLSIAYQLWHEARVPRSEPPMPTFA
jgi:uncharacterized protein (DUF1697 family)